MSSPDLHFYLIPKKEVIDKEPSIEFMSISVATILGEEISSFVPRDGKKHILTVNIMYGITMQLQHAIGKAEKELNLVSSFLKCAEIHNLESLDAYFEDFKNKSEDLQTLKEAASKLEVIVQMVDELEYTDCAAIEVMIC